MGDFRKLLTTVCPECVVDVSAFHWSDDDSEVCVGLLPGHDAMYFGSWRGKLARIARVLRGESYPALTFHTRQEAEATRPRRS